MDREPTVNTVSQTKVEQKAAPTYTDRTNRIQAWSQFIRSLTPFIWLTVIVIVIIPLIGNIFIARSIDTKYLDRNLDTSNESVAVIERTIPNQNEIDRAIVTAIKDARTKAKEFAASELDKWVEQLNNHVDHSFLNWYFDYFNQKKMEFSAPFVWLSSQVAHRLDTNNPPPNQAVAEKLTEDFQTEFAKRVLRPRIAQLQLERITKDTINLYVSQLDSNISSIQSNYNLPQVTWQRYLDDIAFTISDTEGNISNLSMKILAGGSTYLLAKTMIPVVTKIGSKMALSFAGSAGTKMAAKTGGVVAGKLGVQFLDPIVAVGIIIWDVWDYNHTVKIEKPVLREAILEYLEEVKASLLDNHKDSIMAAIYQVEDGILKSLTARESAAYQPT